MNHCPPLLRYDPACSPETVLIHSPATYVRKGPQADQPVVGKVKMSIPSPTGFDPQSNRPPARTNARGRRPERLQHTTAPPVIQDRGLSGLWWSMALLCSLLLFCVGTGAQANSKPIELHVLFDVSGSMRANDPDNLRIPALRLLGELAPEGIKVGIWLFAQGVEPLIPPTTVDAAWRQQVSGQLSRIHARGLFTDIEQAIAVTSQDWLDAAPNPEDQRHLLLFTDGLVDLEAGIPASLASRERLLTQWTATLGQAGVHLHAIGLSEGIDTRLLEQLTEQTDGWLEVILDPDELHRVFLRMLEQTAPPTTLPLRDNHFSVDDRIQEFTVLVFREPGHAVQLVNPRQQAYTRPSHPASVRWHQEDSYDLITVMQPDIGSWYVDSPTDPDNRVVIVTDLDLHVEPLPQAFWPGDRATVTAWALEQGQPIRQGDFLDVMRLQASLRSVNATEPDGALQFDLTRTPDHHRFSHPLPLQTLPVGEYELVVNLMSDTFERSLRKRLRLRESPLLLEYQIQDVLTGETPQTQLRVELHVTDPTLHTEQHFGYLRLIGPDQRVVIHDLLPGADRMTHQFVLPYQGIYQLDARLSVRDSMQNLRVFQHPALTIPVTAGLPAVTEAATSDTPLRLWDILVYLLLANGLFLFLAGMTWALMDLYQRRHRRQGKTGNEV